MKKKISFLWMISSCILIPAVNIGAEQITKVAVLDYAKILSTFYTDSNSVRRIEQMKEDFSQEVQRLQSEIQELEEKKLSSESRDALEINNEIQEKRRYYQEYVRVRGTQIQQAENDLSGSDELARAILREIQYIAESNGYSLVLKRSDPNLLWWSYEIDITDLVLQQLTKSR